MIHALKLEIAALKGWLALHTVLLPLQTTLAARRRAQSGSAPPCPERLPGRLLWPAASMRSRWPLCRKQRWTGCTTLSW